MKRCLTIVLAVLVAAVLVAAGRKSGSAGARRDAPSLQALRLIQSECAVCHNEEKKKGDLIFTTEAGLARGNDEGPVVIPGKPDESRIIKVLAAGSDPHMPPKKQLEPRDINLLREWVRKGAPWDAAALEIPIQPVALEEPSKDYHPVLALAISPDGRRLAFGRGAALVVCDLTRTNFPEVATFRQGHDPVQSIAWSQDGSRLAAGAFRRIELIDGSTLQPVRTITNGLAGMITALNFSAGSLVAADSLPVREGILRLINPATGAAEGSWKAHSDSIFDLKSSRDGTRLLTGGGDRMVKIWDFKSKKELSRLEGHWAQVLGVDFNTNATQVVSAGADKQLKVWEVKSREPISNLGNHSGAMTAVAWVENGKTIVAATDAGELYTYTNLKEHTGEQSSASGDEKRVAGVTETIQSIAAAEDLKVIAAGTHDGTVYVFSRDGKQLAKIGAEAAPPKPAVSAAPSDKGKPQARRTLRGKWSEEIEARMASAHRGESSIANPKKEEAPISFVRDVLPVLSRAGCNAGSCHAKPEGQNGFKLSVFSYDPKTDYGEIVRDSRNRRIFPAAPEESLILKKPMGLLPHEGGIRFKPGSQTHQILVRWIRQGMPYSVPGEPALTGIAVTPADGQYRKGAGFKLRVEARYSDGSSRDVSSLASFDSNDKEMARVDEQGRVSVGRLTGQGVVLARYMGFVADAQILVPADRVLPGKRYAALPRNNFVDDLAYAQFQRLGLFPSELCPDSEFARRSSLDLIGRLPRPEELRAFLEDNAPEKREKWIDRLLHDPAYADYWANQWADLLRPNPDRVGVKSVYILDQWLREQFRENRRFDEFARALITAEGSNHRDGPAVVYRDRREPPELTTLFTQVLLGTRLECARCHHHPNEKWSQDDFYQFAAFFGAVKQKGAGLSPPISAGTESFYFAPGGAVKHPVTGQVMKPRPLDGAEVQESDQSGDPRERLADWVTDAKNPFFARAIVNRVWGSLFGRGFVHPVDDFRISNPCVNPALLDALAGDFVKSGYNLKHLLRVIAQSRIYQLSSTPNEFNMSDTRNFSRSYRRRLPAEVLLDMVSDVTGAPDKFAGTPPGARAMETWTYKIESHFLDAFGRPNASSDCPCERDRQMSVVQSLHLMNAKTIQQKLSQKGSRVQKLVESAAPPEKIAEELYLAALSRFPDAAETKVAQELFARHEKDRQKAAEDLLWALLNTPEFVMNH